ncbi:hypothetical protein BDV95DRAFT_307989 [Massariosphaeria phaeospora]|uniref:Secreted protein n=1 Tax=Massariosphaeria phaeospora TaxID=100035 RepID=A0A7C8IB52_9PLEO|nr:hypothetical protein BDV95DRAFT_307989 [Massariosphaeria phaeospora]
MLKGSCRKSFLFVMVLRSALFFCSHERHTAHQQSQRVGSPEFNFGFYVPLRRAGHRHWTPWLSAKPQYLHHPPTSHPNNHCGNQRQQPDTPTLTSHRHPRPRRPETSETEPWSCAKALGLKTTVRRQ